MCETKVTSIMVQMGKVIVKLSNNNLISAKLIVAADGRNSDIRFLSDISLKKWDNPIHPKPIAKIFTISDKDAVFEDLF